MDYNHLQRDSSIEVYNVEIPSDLWNTQILGGLVTKGTRSRLAVPSAKHKIHTENQTLKTMFHSNQQAGRTVMSITFFLPLQPRPDQLLG